VSKVTNNGNLASINRAKVLSQCRGIKQRLRWVLHGTLACIDHGHARPLSYIAMNTVLAVSKDESIEAHCFNRAKRLTERLALFNAATCCMKHDS
jgi:hypothetical protein